MGGPAGSSSRRSSCRSHSMQLAQLPRDGTEPQRLRCPSYTTCMWTAALSEIRWSTGGSPGLKKVQGAGHGGSRTCRRMWQVQAWPELSELQAMDLEGENLTLRHCGKTRAGR